MGKLKHVSDCFSAPNLEALVELVAELRELGGLVARNVGLCPRLFLLYFVLRCLDTVCALPGAFWTC